MRRTEFVLIAALLTACNYMKSQRKLAESWDEIALEYTKAFFSALDEASPASVKSLQPLQSESREPEWWENESIEALERNETFVIGNARDEAGNWNFRIDPYLVRRKKLEELREDEPNIATHHGVVSKMWFDSDEEREAICNTQWGKPLTNNVLRRIVLNGKDPLPEPIKVTDATTILHQTNTSAIIPMPLREPIDPFRSSNEIGRPRVLGVVYTYAKHHALLPAIIDTYGWRYDGFFAASSKTDRELAAVNLTKIGPESYNNMWQKTRSIVHYVHKHFVDEFDYVHIMGDDVSVIFENLQNYLTSFEEQNKAAQPLFIGSLCPGRIGLPFFAGGGPGYILNMATVRKFAQHACFKNRKTSAEDLMMSKCMKRMGIALTDSADKAHRQRMFSREPDFVASSFGRGHHIYWETIWKLQAEHHGWKWGADIVSTDTAVFHHMKTNVEKRQFHALMYRSCPESTVLGQYLSQQDVYFQNQLKL